MDKAKRARTAETPKQPSLGLKLRAPYLYPDRGLGRPSPIRAGGRSNLAGGSGSEPVKPRNETPAWNGLRECRECRAVGQSAKAMSASKFWNISVSESPGSERMACQEGMCSESSEPLAGRLGAPAQRRHRV